MMLSKRISAVWLPPVVLPLLLTACDRDHPGAVERDEAAVPDASGTSEASPEERASKEELSDHRIELAVLDALLLEGAVPEAQLAVDVQDGVAHLSGEATQLQAKKLAIDLAQATKGVVAVVDRIEVDAPQVGNAELVRRVNDALLINPATEAFEVEVSAEDGKVTLSGEVDSWAEKSLATDVATRVSGVREVDNDLSVEIKAMRPDAEILRDVRQRLAADVLVDDGLVGVSVDKGIVELRGIVGSAAEKWRAVASARVQGVVEVEHDDLNVEWWDRERFRRDPSDFVKGDDQLLSALHHALGEDPRVDAEDVQAFVDNARVTLTGEVPSAFAKRAAGDTARHTVGVQRVRNALSVEVGQLNDDELLERIERAIELNSLVEDWQGDVAVDRGYVVLRGPVSTNLERERLVEVVERVRGVKGVHDRLELYWRTLSDRDLKSDIRDQLVWNVFVEEDNVEIVVEDGVASLTGTVADYRAYEQAADAALAAGALSVVNRLKIDADPSTG